MVPYEAFLSEKPVLTTLDAGGPLEVVPTARPVVVVAPECRPRSPRRARTSAAHVDEAQALGRAGKEIAERVTWDACVDALLADEGRLLLAAAAVALRDRRLLDAAPARAARARSTSSSPSRASAHRRRRRALPRRQRPGRARLDRRCAATSGPASSCCTSTCCTISSPGSRSAAETDAATSTRWSASSASPGGCSALGVLDNLLPLLWETQPERFPLAGHVLDRAHGLIVHSRYVARARASARATRGRSGGSRIRRGRRGDVEPAGDVSGDPLIGCFGFLNMNKRIPQLLEAFASLRRERPGRAAAARRRAGRALRPRAPARAARARRTASTALDYVPEERMWSLMAACDVLVNLRYPTMGETSGSVIRGALARQAAGRLRRRLVRASCPTTWR